MFTCRFVQRYGHDEMGTWIDMLKHKKACNMLHNH